MPPQQRGQAHYTPGRGSSYSPSPNPVMAVETSIETHGQIKGPSLMRGLEEPPSHVPPHAARSATPAADGTKRTADAANVPAIPRLALRYSVSPDRVPTAAREQGERDRVRTRLPPSPSAPAPEGDRIFLSTATATAEAAASDEAVEAVKAAAAAAREVVQQCLPRGVSKQSAVECKSEIL